MSKIFVFVPTMKDSEYIFTIQRMMENASRPENINVGTTIFWKPKDVEGNNVPFFYKIEEYLKNNTNVRYDIMSFSEAPGVGGGRTESIKHYNGEKYCLSIDSHTVFEKGWDEKLIELYHESEKDFGKRRLLTTYLPHYAKSGQPFSDEGEFVVKDGCTLSKDNKWPYFTFEWTTHPPLTKDYKFPLPSDKTLADNDPFFDKMIDNKFLPAKKINANFNFTEADPWIKDFAICLSPQIDFWGEEFFQSIVSYSRGYQFVFIKEKIMWHLYSSSTGISVDESDGSIKKQEKVMDRGQEFEKYAKEFENEGDRISYLSRHVLGKKSLDVGHRDDNELVSKLLNNELVFNYLPRSVNGYLKYAGIDLVNRKVSPWNEVPKLDVIYK